MQILYYNDLHLHPATFLPLEVPTFDNERDMVLCIGGDTAEKAQSVHFLHEVSQRFKAVVKILGNHDYYGLNVPNAVDKIRRVMIKHYGNYPNNLHILSDSLIHIDDVTFVGGTLWTDVNNSDPASLALGSILINDYKSIRTGPSHSPWSVKLTPEDTVRLHDRTKQYITHVCKNLRDKDSNHKIVVMTHHAPTYQSLDVRFKGQSSNCYYYSNLDGLIEYLQPNYWLHGHIHKAFDYKINNTRIVCNPRGYHTKKGYVEDGCQFDPKKILQI